MTKALTTKRSNDMGFSAVELIVVMAIIAVVSAIALLQFKAPNTQFQRQNVARQLKVAFERARFDSVKRHAENPGPATVVVGATTYTLTTDNNQDGVFQSAESVVSDFSAQGITIQGITPSSLPTTVTFDRRGEVNATGGSAPPLQFRVCNGTCPSTPSASTSDIVVVTPTGTVNLLSGTATTPTYANANVTSVNSVSGISNVGTVPANIP